MRISADKGDPGYTAYATAPNRTKIEVYLDGVLQKHVVTADTDEGWLLRLKEDDKGNLFIDHTTNRIAAERCTGKVEIRGL